MNYQLCLVNLENKMIDVKNPSALKYFTGQKVGRNVNSPEYIEPEDLMAIQKSLQEFRGPPRELMGPPFDSVPENQAPVAKPFMGPPYGDVPEDQAAQPKAFMGPPYGDVPEDKQAAGDVNPDALASYLDSLKAEEDPFSSDKLKEGISTYQKDKLKSVNFSPLAALADKWAGGGSQLTAAAKSMIDKEVYNKDVAREEARNQRQDKAQKYASKDFNNDLRKDTKNIEENLRLAGPVLSALTPQQGEGGVRLQRISAAITNAGRLLGNLGVQTEGDANRTQEVNNAVFLWTTLKSKLASNPNEVIPVEQVNNLRKAIEEAVEGQRATTAAKVKLTRDSYVTGGRLSSEEVDGVANLYSTFTDRAKSLGQPTGEASTYAPPTSSSAPAPAVDETDAMIEAIRKKKKQAAGVNGN
jgi:hypothetical protein